MGAGDAAAHPGTLGSAPCNEGLSHLKQRAEALLDLYQPINSTHAQGRSKGDCPFPNQRQHTLSWGLRGVSRIREPERDVEAPNY